MVNTQHFQQLQLLFNGGQLCQSLVGVYDMAGMRVEGDDDAFATQAFSLIYDSADDGLMSLVHTIESADGYYGVAEGFQLVQMAVHFHPATNLLMISGFRWKVTGGSPAYALEKGIHGHGIFQLVLTDNGALQGIQVSTAAQALSYVMC